MTRIQASRVWLAAGLAIAILPGFLARANAQYGNGGQYGDQGYPQNGDQGYGQNGYPQNGEYGQNGNYQGDPPARAARITYERGAVSLQTSGAQQWSDAQRNYPLTSGDRIYVDNGGRAEVQAGQTVVRMGSASDLTVTNLTDELTQLGLAQGTVRLRTYGLNPNATVELDTPNGAITVVRPGDVRVDSYQGDGGTLVTVNTGSVQISGPGISQQLRPGEAVRLTGYDPVQVIEERMPGYDDFDRFSIDRDRHILNSGSARYVSRDVVGYDDLDDYGSWDTTPDYGPVWYPRQVATDWAPYRNGRWAYVSPWGWTWIEDEPWGFAPFHYGRWAYYRDRWGWVPGPVAVAPVYSPALVVFIGGGGLGGYGGGGGISAWFPLGVGEPYVPWYRCSPRYVERVNVTNVNIVNIHNTTIVNNYNNFISNTRTVNNVNNINVNNIRYAHQTVVTAVPQQAFASGRPVRESVVRVDPAQLRQATVVRQGPAPIQPAREAVVRPVTHAAPPVPVQRPVVLTKAGPAVALPHAQPQQVTPATRVGEARPGQPNQQNQPGARPGQTNQQNQPNQPYQGGTRAGQPVPPNQPAQQGGARPGQVAPGQPTPRPGAVVERPGTVTQRPGAVNQEPGAGATSNQQGNRPLITRTPPPAAGSTAPNRLPPPSRETQTQNGAGRQEYPGATTGRPGEVTPRTAPAPTYQETPSRTPAAAGAQSRPPVEERPQPAVERQQQLERQQQMERQQQLERQQQVQRQPAPVERAEPQGRPQYEGRPPVQERPQPAERPQQVERPQVREQPEPRQEPQERPREETRPVPPPQAYSRPAPAHAQPVQPAASYRPAPPVQSYRPAPAQAYRPAPQQSYARPAPPAPQQQSRPAPQQQSRPAPQQQHVAQQPQHQERPQPQQHPVNDKAREGHPQGR